MKVLPLQRASEAPTVVGPESEEQVVLEAGPVSVEQEVPVVACLASLTNPYLEMVSLVFEGPELGQCTSHPGVPV